MTLQTEKISFFEPNFNILSQTTGKLFIQSMNSGIFMTVA